MSQSVRCFRRSESAKARISVVNALVLIMNALLACLNLTLSMSRTQMRQDSPTGASDSSIPLFRRPFDPSRHSVHTVHSSHPFSLCVVR